MPNYFSNRNGQAVWDRLSDLIRMHRIENIPKEVHWTSSIPFHKGKCLKFVETLGEI